MNINQEERRLKDKILESKINWWNGLMIFSGLVIAFLACQDKKLFSFLLIFLYFLIATLSIFLIFKLRNFYQFFEKNYLDIISRDISELKREKDIKWAEKEGNTINRTEKALKVITFSTIILTFFYLFQELLLSFICN